MTGRCWVRPGAGAELADLGLRGEGPAGLLAAALALGGGEVLRRTSLRENILLRSATGSRYYLKRYTVDRWRHGARGLWRLHADPLDGWRERRAHAALEAQGLPVPQVLAAGRLREGSRQRSFILTRALEDAEPLDDQLRRIYPRPGWVPLRTQREAGAGVRRVLRAVAEIVRRLHEAGWVHRDLYACHVLVRREGWRPDDALGPRPVIIDLQRARRAPLDGFRLRIKDLAALAYGLRDTPATATDHLRLLRAYLGRDRASLCFRPREDTGERRLWRRVVAKAAAIARHDAARRCASAALPREGLPVASPIGELRAPP